MGRIEGHDDVLLMSRDAYWSRGDDQPPYADKAVIGRLELERGQRFLYLFDFGDEWKFEVRVEEILDSDVPPVRPLVIGTKPSRMGFPHIDY